MVLSLRGGADGRLWLRGWTPSGPEPLLEIIECLRNNTLS